MAAVLSPSDQVAGALAPIVSIPREELAAGRTVLTTHVRRLPTPPVSNDDAERALDDGLDYFQAQGAKDRLRMENRD